MSGGTAPLFTPARPSENGPDIDWKRAGVALCNADDVERVTERLKAIIRSTNAAFATHLAEAGPTERARLMEKGSTSPRRGPRRGESASAELTFNDLFFRGFGLAGL